MRFHVPLHAHLSPSFGSAEVIGMFFTEDTFRFALRRLRDMQLSYKATVRLLFPDGTIRTVSVRVMDLTDADAVLALNRRKAGRMP